MVLYAAVFVLALIGVTSVNGVDWDYLTFTHEWPPAFCMTEKCDKPASINAWNIHGLWPSVWSGKDPSSCPGPDFNMDKLKPIYEQLKVKWADLENFNNPTKFWTHEWEKHGRCAVSDPIIHDELGYFNTSIHLSTKMDLSNQMTRNGIVPTKTKTYLKTDVLALLKKIYGVQMLIRCESKKGAKQSIWLETRICVDRNLKPIDCKEDDTLYFHPIKSTYTDDCKDELILIPA